MKVVFIFFINLCSRMQKLKFKTDFKEKIKDNCWLFSVFLWSFLAYAVIYGIIFIIRFCIYKFERCKKWILKENYDKNNKEYLIEELILGGLFLIFLFVFITSITFYIIKDSEKIIIYISIVLTGSVNFLLYDFYSRQEVEYISLSGIVSISSLIFRLVELIWEPFESNSDYIIQFIVSFIGLILTLIYIFGVLTEDRNFCFCV